MKSVCPKLALILGVTFVFNGRSATCYVDCANLNPVFPFASWSSAATNIQDAIDASSAGDIVLVTNGVYASGGKVTLGDVTNRIALDKPISVQSVNGPFSTVIEGLGALNGPNAVRCAWLTNGATLKGFTLRDGAVNTSGDYLTNQVGGGVWCYGYGSFVDDCIIESNSAGGAFNGFVRNSLILGNSGAYSGAFSNILINCTVLSNRVGAAVAYCRTTNCIVFYNSIDIQNSYSTVNTCSRSSPPGWGNITSDPQLLPDGIHLNNGSPCIAAGTNVTTGTDIYGQVWATPSSIGCCQWQLSPLIWTQPNAGIIADPISLRLSIIVIGKEPITCFWAHDGITLEDGGRYSSVHTTNLVINAPNVTDLGAYTVIVSNAFGMVTSQVAQVVGHFVNSLAQDSTPPFLHWTDAATNIQDAINASQSGEIVFVTNGIYAAGGKVVTSDLTNRVVIDKPILVQSINGADATTIQGNWNPTVTNGPAAVRCVWMTNGAVLNGFTVRGGATRWNGNAAEYSGGGVWGASTNAAVWNCTIATNIAYNVAGGAYQVSLNNCAVIGNRAVGSGTPGLSLGGAGAGGGAGSCNLRNCKVIGNYADQGSAGGTLTCNLRNCVVNGNSSYFYGGACYQGTLVNCTASGNISAGYGGYGAAVASASATNCIIWNNTLRPSGFTSTNYYNCTLDHCDSSPPPPGSGNLAADPQLLPDAVHLAETSPCRSMATNIASGTDIDGQAWANPPSIGCDEWNPMPVVAIQPGFQIWPVSGKLKFNAAVAGQSPSYSWYKDGALLQEDSRHVSVTSPSFFINRFGTMDDGSYVLVASNSTGVVTSSPVRVTVRCVDAGGMNPAPPYLTWGTAATNIQDAIDACDAGEIVLVTNGVYSVAGKIKAGDLMNRVALDKPIYVLSVNGLASTIIQGQWDALSTNGPGAVRCAWLTDGAFLAGFTLRNGATRSAGDQSGGGVWASSTNAVVANCLLTNNTAAYEGGGAFSGTIINSIIVGNNALFGGGTAYSTLNNCVVRFNSYNGAGAAAGTYLGTTRNSIVLNNVSTFFDGDPFGRANYDTASSTYFYSCTYPPISGNGNITATPIFLDSACHLPVLSPCRGAGSAVYAAGEDNDGESWAIAPSIGCDEVYETNLVGAISLVLKSNSTNALINRFIFFTSSITGRVSRLDWSFGDSTVATNVGPSVLRSWSNPGTYSVSLTAFNTDHPEGVSTNVLVTILPLDSPMLQPALTGSNSFSFSFNAQTGANYTISYATNLTSPINWRVLQSIFFSPGGPVQVTDRSITNPVRFYRVQVQ